MNVAEIFIRRPVMTTLVTLGILIFGIMGYRLLPVSDLPNVDFPTILVSASLPGATPDTMASAVAMPLEKQFSTIAGVDSMTSSSTQGFTQITLQFNLSRNLDAAAQDVQSMIAKAARDLPQNLPSPPSYQKVNPADQPILYLSLNSPTLRLSDVDEYAETLMAQRISMVSGVAQVSVYGAQKYAVHAKLDPKALASRQIGIDEVSNAIQAGNVNLPTGILYGRHQAFTVQANGQLTKAADYGPLVVAYRNGAPVRLRDLRQIVDGVENDKTASWYYDSNGLRRGIILAIQRQPGTNTVEVVDSIKQLMPSFRAVMPPSVSIDTLYDRSVSIRSSVDDVKFTLFLALVLVILVIFLFLRNLSATAIPSMALPMSIVGTFAVMYLLGYSLDNLSLMALTLSVGFVVDDAIVMLENIVRHLEQGKKPLAAALDGSREISFTTVSMTLSPAAVLGGTVWLFAIMPTGFLPSEDTGQAFAFTEAAQGIGFDEMASHQQALAAIVGADPNVDAYMSSIGATGPNATSNSGRIFMRLKPRSQRELTADQVIGELRPKLARVPGIRAFLQNPPPIRIGGTLTKSLYQLTLQDPDTAELYKYAPMLEERLRAMGGLQDVTSDLQIKTPQVSVQIDRDKATALGLSAQQVEDALYTAYGARWVSTIYAPNNEYRVVMEVAPQYQWEPSSLAMLYVRSSSGALVPLETVARLRRSTGPLTVAHLGQLPAVTLSFNLRPGTSLGEAVAAVERESRANLPPTITTSFQGTAQAFECSFRVLGWLLLIVIFGIYIVLRI